MNGGPEGILDARLTEIALFVGGGIVTVMVLALAIWLFVRASRLQRSSALLSLSASSWLGSAKLLAETRRCSALPLGRSKWSPHPRKTLR